MPTLGWVQEAAWDRILYATESAPEPAKAQPPAFRCPFCGASYPRSDDFQEHLGRSHQVARPVMLIDGEEQPQGFVLRRALGASDIAFVNTTRVRLSIDNNPAQTVNAKDVWRTLKGIAVARVRIWIENIPQKKSLSQNWVSITTTDLAVATRFGKDSESATPEPVETSYDITLRIASTRALQAVERAFEEHLNIADYSPDCVSAFLADGRCKGAAEDYASGIAEYALGVLVKEGRRDPALDSTLSQYRDHFGSALMKFAVHNRPLPKLLSAFIRFSINDFSQAGRASGHHVLDLATTALGNPAKGGWAPSAVESGSLRHVCTIDDGTDRILRLAGDLFSATRWTVSGTARHIGGPPTVARAATSPA